MGALQIERDTSFYQYKGMAARSEWGLTYMIVKRLTVCLEDYTFL